MNKLIVDNFNFDRLKDTEVLNFSDREMTTLRFEPEEVYGKHGYVVNTDRAYDGYEGEIQILTESEEDRLMVKNLFLANEKILNIARPDKNLYQYGKVIKHVINQVINESYVHFITIKYEPFYYKYNSNGLATFTKHEDTLKIRYEITNNGDVEGEPIVLVYTNSASKVTILTDLIERDEFVINCNGRYIVDCLDKSIRDFAGQSKNRSIVRGDFITVPVGESIVYVNGASGSDFKMEERYLLL